MGYFYASGNGKGNGNGKKSTVHGDHSLVHDLTTAQWLALQNHFQLSAQQGVIVRLLLTQPWYECNHIDLAKLLGVKKSCIGTQVEILMKRIGVHSRMHVSQTVDYEVVRRGWVRAMP